MAKRRMMRRRSARRSGPRPDWVYRSDLNAQVPLTGTDQLGTYTYSAKTINNGFVNAQLLSLYDSANAMKRPFATVSATLAAQNGAARAEGRRPTILAVDGFINIIPTTWAIASEINLAWRIIAAEQDPATGVGSLDGFYSMWTDNGFGRAPASYANETRNLREGRLMHTYSTSNDQAMWNIGIRWKGRWNLQPNMALFLYLENASATISCRVRPFLRTLVLDEG